MSSQVNSISAVCVCVFFACVCAWACLYPSDKLLSSRVCLLTPQWPKMNNNQSSNNNVALPSSSLYHFASVSFTLFLFCRPLLHFIYLPSFITRQHKQFSEWMKKVAGQEIVFNCFSFFVFVRLPLPSPSLPHKLFLSHIYYMSASAPLSCFLVLCPLCMQNCMWILYLCTFYWLLMLFRVILLLLKALCTASL